MAALRTPWGRPIEALVRCLSGRSGSLQPAALWHSASHIAAPSAKTHVNARQAVQAYRKRSKVFAVRAYEVLDSASTMPSPNTYPIFVGGTDWLRLRR